VFERFTTSARAVVTDAVEEARRRDSPAIGVEHVLVALAGQTDPATARALEAAGLTRDRVEAIVADVALSARRGGLGPADAEALASIGIDLDAIVAGIEAAHGEGALAPAQRPHHKPLLRRQRRRQRQATATKPRRHRPFTPDAKRVLERSLHEAVAMGDRELTPMHILLGVVTGGDPVGQALVNRGVTPELVRSAFGTA
jgi:ATP-dependent Clp protease ATP-binding subunit ClpA